jgi:hypothetical protein
MEQFANDTPELRDEGFQESAAQLGMSKAIIEKDFWVCWSLKQLFALPVFGEQMIFKGGTSLSKAYDVIHRFSEDVDLSLDREQLGFVGDRDPDGSDLSGKKQKKLLQELQEVAEHAVGGQLLAEIQTAFDANLEHEFTLSVDPNDAQTILFAYPSMTFGRWRHQNHSSCRQIFSAVSFVQNPFDLRGEFGCGYRQRAPFELAKINQPRRHIAGINLSRDDAFAGLERGQAHRDLKRDQPLVAGVVAHEFKTVGLNGDDRVKG